MNGSALYHFVSEGAMKAEINAHRYIEFGKHKQHLYGIKVDSVLEVVESGCMCVLDVNLQVRSLAIILTHNLFFYVGVQRLLFLITPPPYHKGFSENVDII